MCKDGIFHGLFRYDDDRGMTERGGYMGKFHGLTVEILKDGHHQVALWQNDMMLG